MARDRVRLRIRKQVYGFALLRGKIPQPTFPCTIYVGSTELPNF